MVWVDNSILYRDPGSLVLKHLSQCICVDTFLSNNFVTTSLSKKNEQKRNQGVNMIRSFE